MVNAIRLLAYTLLSCLLELLKGLSCTLEEARERLGDNIECSSGSGSPDFSDTESVTSLDSRDNLTNLGPVRRQTEEVINCRSTNTLCSILRLTLQMVDLCDVIILVGPQETPVYRVRAVMGIRSCVLYQPILKNQAMNKTDHMSYKNGSVTSSLFPKVVIPVKKNDAEVFRMLVDFVHCGQGSISEDAVARIVLIFVLVSCSRQREPTTIDTDYEELDLGDDSPRTEYRSLEVKQDTCIRGYGATDINLGSDEADVDDQEIDGCSDDVGKEAEYDQNCVKLKELEGCSDDVENEAELDHYSFQQKLQDLLDRLQDAVLSLITKCDMRLREAMKLTRNGTAPRRCSKEKRISDRKTQLRSLDVPCWLAEYCSRHQQVWAVSFTQFDEAIDWPINFIRRIIIPIQETDPGDGFVSLADARGLRERNRCLRRRSCCQPDPPLANSVSAVGSEPTPANSCSAVGSVPEVVGAISRTTPGQVDGTAYADTDQIPDVSALEEENDRLRRQRDCVVCLCITRKVVFMPCRHLVSCQECSAMVTSCPVCRRDIARRVDVLLHPED